MIELASILVLGIFAQWLAWRVKLPAILPLILLGLFLGPISTLFTENGEKLISGDEIFHGELLFSFVALSVGVILFEGGLTLNVKELKNVAVSVRNLLTIGVLVTLIGGTLAAHFILDLNYRISFLFGALIIVSGPTVISPILRNVRPSQNINTILKWESILIDPLGAFIAVLAYEFIRSSKPQDEFTFMVLKDFILMIAMGIFIGGLFALLLHYLLRKNRIPAYLRNVVSLAVVVFAFGFSEFLMHETGLLAVTVMGAILANLNMDEIKEILSFKEDVSIILISVLFLLLSSRIEMDQIYKLGFESIILFVVVILLIRPLGVFLSTMNSNLNLRERIFISWIGPKGIVAAAVASLFSIELTSGSGDITSGEMNDAEMLLPLVFMVIVGTVVLQGSTAKLLARYLNVERRERQGVLFVGANEAARILAHYLSRNGVPVILADTSQDNIREVRKLGLPYYKGDILKENVFEELDLGMVGKLFAFTSSSEINMLSCLKFEKEFGKENVFRLITKREAEMRDIDKPKNLLFDGGIDLFNLIHTLRRDPEIKEYQFESESEYESWISKNKKQIIPLFIKTAGQKFRVITSSSVKISKGDSLVYLEVNEEEEFDFSKGNKG